MSVISVGNANRFRLRHQTRHSIRSARGARAFDPARGVERNLDRRQGSCARRKKRGERCERPAPRACMITMNGPAKMAATRPRKPSVCDVSIAGLRRLAGRGARSRSTQQENNRLSPRHDARIERPHASLEKLLARQPDLFFFVSRLAGNARRLSEPGVVPQLFQHERRDIRPRNGQAPKVISPHPDHVDIAARAAPFFSSPARTMVQFRSLAMISSSLPQFITWRTRG